MNLSDLTAAPYNPRTISDTAMGGLQASMDAFGDVSGLVFNRTTGRLVAGHQRVQSLLRQHGDLAIDGDMIRTPDGVEFRIRFVDWDELREKAANVTANNPFIQGEFTEGLGGALEELGDLPEFEELRLGEMVESLGDLVPDAEPGDGNDTPPVEPPEDYEPVTASGELIELGAHRVLCGDSTKDDDVERLMGGDRVTLCHADPPYGMGKENDGIENDNLYREKLDAFQMDWWRTFRPHLADNASAYIWGSAPDLWRLWYVGGLADSERLTIRNEIVWDKANESGLYDGNGIGSDGARMFANISERCLFFMLGEQGFNHNADNYWEGWEPIRSYLAEETSRIGWTAKDLNRITGTNMAGHWVSKSQWCLITEEHYRKIQQAAKEHDAFKREHDAFKREHDELKREHDELKREFYSTRAHFDNAHDNMTDVWSFPRVTGEERQGHATPKPVAMIERAIKSSSKVGDDIAEPFLGSGTTLIAAENLNRRCYGIEISPRYVDVIVCRYLKHVGPDKHPELAAKYARLLNA